MDAVGQKIVLVDDDLTFTRLYGSVFKVHGFDYAIARNGVEALQMAASEQPDLILLDIMLPDLNGFEVLKRLKQDPQTSKITVWVITNLAGQLDKEVAVSSGASDYLVKASYTPNQVTE